MAYKLPDLPYAFDVLEPIIDAQTMEIHYTKHHAGYVKKLNAALEGHADLKRKSIEELLVEIDEVPTEIRQAVVNNGGGHANHSLFWRVMMPNGGGLPSGRLAEALEAKFGDISSFQANFSQVASTQFGSGWAWLALNGKELEIFSTPNQNSPLLEGKIPILGLDVWEHAYYLKYQNKRPDYIENWWKVVNWDEVGRRYSLAIS